MKKIFCIIILSMFIGCTNSQGTVDLLTKQGYTNIETTGYSWFACSKDDKMQTGFKAKSPAGIDIYGTVCEGWFFKNKTIRFE